MNPDLYPIVGSIIVSIIIGGSGLLGGIWAYRKNKSDAAKSLVDSALGLMKQYESSLKDCNEASEKILAEQEALVKRAEEAEKRATAAEARVIEQDKTIAYLREKQEEGAADRAQLREMIGMLETQLEGLGYTPRSKTQRTRKGDKKE